MPGVDQGKGGLKSTATHYSAYTAATDTSDNVAVDRPALSPAGKMEPPRTGPNCTFNHPHTHSPL